jgi:hypothetical protein
MPLLSRRLLPLVTIGNLDNGPNLGLRLQQNGKPSLGVVKLPMSILEEGGNLLLTLKPRIPPPSKTKLEINTSGVTKGVLNIWKLVEGRDVTGSILQNGTHDS